jgi:hypothetical protein
LRNSALSEKSGKNKNDSNNEKLHKEANLRQLGT